MINPDPVYVAEIRALTGLTEDKIIQILNQMFIREAARYNGAGSLAEMTIMNASNMFNTGVNAEETMKINQMLQKICAVTVQYDGVDKPVEIGLSNMISDSCTKYFTRYGDDVKRDINDILQNAIRKSQMPNVTAKQIDEYFKQYVTDQKELRGRGAMIARTETMRASNLGSYIGAQQNGATHFKVISRKGRCDKCGALYRDGTFIFSMNDLDKLPPLHPRCRCVPVFFSDIREAKQFKVKEV